MEGKCFHGHTYCCDVIKKTAIVDFRNTFEIVFLRRNTRMYSLLTEKHKNVHCTYGEARALYLQRSTCIVLTEKHENVQFTCCVWYPTQLHNSRQQLYALTRLNNYRCNNVNWLLLRKQIHGNHQFVIIRKEAASTILYFKLILHCLDTSEICKICKITLSNPF